MWSKKLWTHWSIILKKSHNYAQVYEQHMFLSGVWIWIELLLSIEVLMCAPAVKSISNSSCLFKYMIQHSTWYTPWPSTHVQVHSALNKRFVSLHFGLLSPLSLQVSWLTPWFSIWKPIALSNFQLCSTKCPGWLFAFLKITI